MKKSAKVQNNGMSEDEIESQWIAEVVTGTFRCRFNGMCDCNAKSGLLSMVRSAISIMAGCEHYLNTFEIYEMKLGSGMSIYYLGSKPVQYDF